MSTEKVMPIVPPYTPELLPEVQHAIKSYLYGIMNLTEGRLPRVLEFGSGWSTVWLARMGVLLNSAEHDVAWKTAVWVAIVNCILDRDCQVGRSMVHLLPPERIHEMAWSVATGSQDLVLVDCIDEARVRCALESIAALRPDGWLVLDDSHWPMLQDVQAELCSRGYERRVIAGQHIRKTGQEHWHETAFFCKEGFKW
jgi:hypothetical protein